MHEFIIWMMDSVLGNVCLYVQGRAQFGFLFIMFVKKICPNT